ncbi:RNA methylase [Punctularia strigosozonata HHB-11173 SS5]|uniref:RNA methylase n=1 Tax=Punctularia strigosozonata (strain HHB-11173) TaxID=741275 RepID=UPI000441840E|nr:RNA methylase [Punctularia strigosozonata HHB-11173 SS5]EIN11648.1 RNA methylase [Punctularia strigosozonata HHB-11173 SS5]
MQPYLIIFAQIHAEFRIPELQSVAELHGFKIYLPSDFDIGRPYQVIELESDEHARLLARRCILVKSVYEFYARGSTYENMHAENRKASDRWLRYAEDTSFKFSILGYNHTIPNKRQREVCEGFSYMNLQGKIDLKKPELVLGVFEEYTDPRGVVGANPEDQYKRDGQFREVFFGRLIEEGSARPLIHTFDVKKRVFFGNTSMEAEVSLLMANQTMATPGSLVYDPFAGTGSMLYTAAWFGAYVYGSDIDGRQMRGKGAINQTTGIRRAAEQYGVSQRIMDLSTFDMTHHPWRKGSIFDAIVTDPPYGVRAGAKRLGRRKDRPNRPAFDPAQRKDEQPYVPPTSPYELSQLASDLVHLARYLLKPGGRLVFFLPTVNEDYQEIDVATFMCDGMQVIANSLQDFGSWGRRLITIRKTGSAEYPPPTFNADSGGDPVHVPAHRDFREKYFKGFRKDAPSSTSPERPEPLKPEMLS